MPQDQREPGHFPRRAIDYNASDSSMYRASRILFAAAVALFAQTVLAQVRQPAASIPGQIIVWIEDDGTTGHQMLDSPPPGYNPVRLLIPRLGIWLFEYDDSLHGELGALSMLANLSGIRAVQPNREVQLRESHPDDPRFTDLWGFRNTGQSGGTPGADIDALRAWNLSDRGMTAAGDSIVIAIIDDGFALPHPDLRFFRNAQETPGNGQDDDGNGYIDDYYGWNAVTSSGTITYAAHGTHVTGSAAARGNNGTGVIGVAPNALIMPIQGMSSNEAVVMEAYGYALEMRARYNESAGEAGAFIVAANSSFGIDYAKASDFPIWCALFDEMGAHGIVSVAATANRNVDVDTVGDMPTTCPSPFLISVTNTTRNDLRNSGAAFGATSIDLGAPGTAILSAVGAAGYGTATGTSMSAPLVAGTLGLLAGALSPALAATALVRPDSVATLLRQALLAGVDMNPALQGITTTGGRLNSRKALEALLSRDASTILISQDTVWTDITFAGKDVYVLEDATVEVQGTLSLVGGPHGHPTRFFVLGTLLGGGSISLDDPSLLQIRPTGRNFLSGWMRAPGAGRALLLSDQVVGSRADVSFGAEGALSISLWLKLGSSLPQGARTTLVELRGSDGRPTFAVALESTDSGVLLNYRETSVTGDQSLISIPISLEPERPAHVAVVRSAEPREVAVYLNGELVETALGLPNPMRVLRGTLRVGGGVGDFSAVMDDLRIAGTSDSSGSSLFENSFSTSSLLQGAYYAFDEGDTESAYATDASGRGLSLVAESGSLPRVASPFPIGDDAMILASDGARSGTLLDSLGVTVNSDTAPPLIAYAYLNPTNTDSLPAGLTTRSSRVWGVWAVSDVEATLSFLLPPIPPGASPPVLLTRLAGDGAWVIDENASLDTQIPSIRVPFEWTHSAAREYALGADWPVPGDPGVGPRPTTLHPAYPNPVRSTTTVVLELAEETHVTVSVFDILGRRVATLHDGIAPRVLPLSVDVSGLSSGIYIIRATGADFRLSQRITVAR
ncbi:hypothetical protein BH23BAC4_BH23BAC4_03690 [soil metagenome]